MYIAQTIIVSYERISGPETVADALQHPERLQRAEDPVEDQTPTRTLKS